VFKHKFRVRYVVYLIPLLQFSAWFIHGAFILSLLLLFTLAFSFAPLLRLVVFQLVTEFLEDDLIVNALRDLNVINMLGLIGKAVSENL
jgi:hypothetical protein